MDNFLRRVGALHYGTCKSGPARRKLKAAPRDQHKQARGQGGRHVFDTGYAFLLARGIRPLTMGFALRVSMLALFPLVTV